MGDRMASVFMRTHYRNRVGTVGRASRLGMIRALRWSPRPRTPRRIALMEGINWLDLFNAMDRFLVAIVERNVVLVYSRWPRSSSRRPGSSSWRSPGRLAAVRAGAVSALPQAQAKGLNVYLLMGVITVLQ